MKRLDDFIRKISNSGISITILKSSLSEVGEFKKRKVPAILYPGSIEEIKKIIELANENGIALYPYSMGKNWGLGSKSPVSTGSILVDLSRMDKIRKLDPYNHIILVEPGVTQQKLSDYLRQTKFIANLTSSSPESSVLGNTLDNGIGYLGRKVKDLKGVEMVSGKGILEHCGYFSTISGSADYSRWVPQTSMGIVTAIAIKLNLRPAIIHMFRLIFEVNQMQKVFLAIKKGYQTKRITWVSKLTKQDTGYQLFIPVHGISLSSKIKSQFKNLGILKLIKPNDKLLKNASGELAGHWMLYHGIPNPWPTTSYILSDKQQVDLDKNSVVGLRLFCYFIPLQAKAIKYIDSLLKPFSADAHIQLEYRLNILDHKQIALIIYVHFLRNGQGIKSARTCAEYLVTALEQKGFKPYRLNIDLQVRGSKQWKNKLEMKKYKKLKQRFDPNHIIAPGRYGLE